MAQVIAEICNYQGNREKWNGKGRLARLLESLPKCLIGNHNIIWRCVDSGSTDGSDKELFSFPAQQKTSYRRIDGTTPWESTTKTNAAMLHKSLESANEPFFWRIENDSVFLPVEFVQTGHFLWKAIEVLKRYSEVVIVHLRRWTPVDRADMPGQAVNAARITDSCLEGGVFLIDQVCSDLVWVDISNDVPHWFTPDLTTGYGFCPAWIPSRPVRGAVRREGRRWLRLVAEKFATYTNHGWVGRTESMVEIFKKENPQTEEEISDAVRKHGKAARLSQDAFVCAGWRTRVKSKPSLLKIALDWACKRPWGTVYDKGGNEPIDSFTEIIEAYRNKHQPSVPEEK